jgi:hypothetical protein
MTPLRQRMIEDMQLRGLAPLTQRAYLQAIQQLALYYGKSPEQITDEELRQYFLYLHNEKHVARPRPWPSVRSSFSLSTPSDSLGPHSNCSAHVPLTPCRSC